MLASGNLMQRRRRGATKLAPATVLSVVARASPPRRPYLRLTQKLTLRVEPDGEPGFDATLTVVSTRRDDEHGRRALLPLPELRVGHGVAPAIVVRYDPADVSHVQLVTGPEAKRVRTAYAIRGGQVLDDVVEPEGEGAGTAPESPYPDWMTQLRALAALRDRGVLSESEFVAQKSRLLAQS